MDTYHTERVNRLQTTDAAMQDPEDLPPEIPGGYQSPAQVNEYLARADWLDHKGNKAEAQHILSRVQPYAVKNPRYWWIVAKSATNREQAMQALQSLIALSPKDERAQRMLNKLEQATKVENAKIERKYAGRRRIAAITRLLIFAIIATGVISVIVLVVMGMA